MTEDDIKKQLYAALKKIAPDTEPAQLKPDDNIREALGIDSFDFLRFIVANDKQFGIETPEQDYGKIQTMRSLVAYVAEKKA